MREKGSGSERGVGMRINIEVTFVGNVKTNRGVCYVGGNTGKGVAAEGEWE